MTSDYFVLSALELRVAAASAPAGNDTGNSVFPSRFFALFKINR